MSEEGTTSGVRYGLDYDRRPSFRVRGWDDGSVFVDILCVCGREVFDDSRGGLSGTGAVLLSCPVCHRRFTVEVLCGVSERKGDG